MAGMELTRRGGATAGCGGVLLVGALVLDSPVLLGPAVGIGAWLLGTQVWFLRRLARHRDTLTVSLEADRTRPLVTDEIALTMRVRHGEPTGLSTRLSLGLPAAADAVEEPSIAIGPDGTERGERSDSPETGSATIDANEPAATRSQTSGESIPLSVTTNAVVTAVSWPVSGTFSIDAPTVAVGDPFGLFTEVYEADASLTVSVRPPGTETIHLGKGGERHAAAFGKHTSGGTGSGIEPADLREYQPGEEVSKIDWKATARHGTPYVTEAEAETDRRTVLLLDHRATMGTGREGVTPITYLRHAALAIVESTSELGDPLGLYAVGDAGVTVSQPPKPTPAQYRTIANSIRELEPTEAPASPSPQRTTDSDSSKTGPTRSAVNRPGVNSQADGQLGTAMSGEQLGTASYGGQLRTATQAAGAISAASNTAFATRACGRLSGDDSTFASQLRPLLGDGSPYLHRVESEPLFAAARTYLGRLQGTLWTVLITDDTRRGELRETVRLARRGNDHVLVILAPRALFAADGLADLDAAYREYSAFETFRRELASMDRVEALELAPGDRIETILGASGDRS
jgi:uncharacterized protein (DUF58 family)